MSILIYSNCFFCNEHREIRSIIHDYNKDRFNICWECHGKLMEKKGNGI